MCTQRVDLRRGFDTLCEAARTVMGVDPVGGGLFVFASRRGTRLKMLWVEGPRCFLLWVRVADGVFTLPDGNGQAAVRLEAAGLEQLLQGAARKQSSRSRRQIT